MIESIASFEADQMSAIATIAAKLQLPTSKVGEVYRKEFERLSSQARIPTYLTVLTMRNVRSILGEVGRRAPSH
jgi:hypothetical protein